MAQQFRGAGAPPPRKPAPSARVKSKLPKYMFSEVVTYTKDGQQKTRLKPVFPWRLKPGEKDRPILLLDPADNMYSRYISGPFTAEDGLFGSLLASPFRDDPRGDPLVDVLGKEPTWYWILTGINLQPSKGKFINREPVFVTDRQKQTFLTAQKMGGGLRGHVFNVSRPEDSKSYRIGVEWDFVERLSEEEMEARLAAAASTYGLSLDRFLAPFDYEAMFEPKPYEELERIAKAIAASRAVEEEAKSGVVLAGEGTDNDGEEEDLPF